MKMVRQTIYDTVPPSKMHGNPNSVKDTKGCILDNIKMYFIRGN